jgi:hypothetical protein
VGRLRPARGTVEYVGLILLVSMLMVGMGVAMRGFNKSFAKGRYPLTRRVGSGVRLAQEASEQPLPPRIADALGELVGRRAIKERRMSSLTCRHSSLAATGRHGHCAIDRPLPPAIFLPVLVRVAQATARARPTSSALRGVPSERLFDSRCPKRANSPASAPGRFPPGGLAAPVIQARKASIRLDSIPASAALPARRSAVL